MSTFHTILQRFRPQAYAVRRIYRKLFSVHEIEESLLLQWFYGAMLFGFYTTFNNWISDTLITVENATSGQALCWPYFEQCTSLYFLHAPPYGYSQTILYAAIFGLMMLAVLCMWKRWWTGAHAIMLLLFIWKGLVLFVFTSGVQGGPNYHHFLLVLAFLAAPYKEFFAQLTFILLYSLSAIVKLDDTWVLGTYFTSLQAGLPLFGNAFAPLFTNAVIGLQVVGSWFLMSRRRYLQRSALVLFAIFHVYAGILVGYTYPALALSSLIVLFGPLYVKREAPLTLRSLAGWTIIALLIAFHLPRHIIAGDARFTQEGSHLGLNLFDANHQCVAQFTIYQHTRHPVAETRWSARPGTGCNTYTCLTATHTYNEAGLIVTEQRYESGVAWKRCNPYNIWLPEKVTYCSKPGVERVSMTFDHSIDGGPFYRMIDQANICDLTYQPFTHNDWIRIPPDAPIVGYPVKDVYRYANQAVPSPYDLTPNDASSSSLIVLKELQGNEPASLTPLQRALTPYAPALVDGWLVVWFLTLLIAVFLGFRAARRRV